MEGKGYMLQVDVSKCLGCHSCEIACALEHTEAKELEQAVRNGERPVSRVKVCAAGDAAVPLQCRQCQDAPCMAVCPVKAISRLNQDSPVLIDYERCIGCRWCILACPFGVIYLARSGRTVVKCDQCFERVKRGELPACVQACPTKALQLRALDEIVAEKRAGYLVQIGREISRGEPR